MIFFPVGGMGKGWNSSSYGTTGYGFEQGFFMYSKLWADCWIDVTHFWVKELEGDIRPDEGLTLQTSAL